MSNLCRLCGSEKRYDKYHRLYKPCHSCNSKRALKHYYINKDKNLKKKNNHYQNNKKFFSEQNKKRKNKITDLENQNSTKPEMIKSTTSVG